MASSRKVLPISQERGVWVYRTGRQPDQKVVEKTLRALRRERDKRAFAKVKRRRD